MHLACIRAEIIIMEGNMSQSQLGGNVFFLLIGAILVFAMHGGFAFLEVGTVRKKTKLTLWSKLYQTLLFQKWFIF